MDINKHIIDQRIRKIVQDKPEWFAESNDENYKVSKSFVLLTVSTLNIELSEVFSKIPNHASTSSANEFG
jgi:hypothetical protein